MWGGNEIPSSPVFQRATLKNWEWPGDKASTSYGYGQVIGWHVYALMVDIFPTLLTNAHNSQKPKQDF